MPETANAGLGTLREGRDEAAVLASVAVDGPFAGPARPPAPGGATGAGPGLISPVAVVALWQLLSSAGLIPADKLPPPTTVWHTAVTVLTKAGLSVHDVTLTYLQPAEGLAALTSGHVDAWDTWSPFIEQAEVQKNARALVTGTGYGSPYSFAVASAPRWPTRPGPPRSRTTSRCWRRRTPGPPATSWPGRPCGPRRAGCRTP